MAELVIPRLYSCCNCRNHVCLHDDIISKAFHSGKTRARSHAMNIKVGSKEGRYLMTGLHTVSDIYCADYHQVLGLKFEHEVTRLLRSIRLSTIHL